MKYPEYLETPQWKDLREQAMYRADNKCEFCRRTGHAVHHVKYPKVFKDDHLDNLVMVCRRCHELCHGIRRGSTPMHIEDLLPELMAGLSETF